jgi:hypothetical protein
MAKYSFVAICMKTKNGKDIYLGEQGKGLGWKFDYNEAVWFETYQEAEKFAKDYFKHFDKWGIKEVYCII